MRLKIKLLLAAIIILAAVLRLYQLGSIPKSLDWDEASLGWNAYSIAKTGSDEYGNVLPLSIRSFNDYKPPMYVYLLVPLVAVFGLAEWAVRFPSAILGIATVFFTFFLVKEMFNKKLALLAAFLLALSPWSINFSRVAFEANIALFFFVAGATFLVLFLSKKRSNFLLLSSILFACSMYSYHSARLVVPLFLLGLALAYRRDFLANIKLTLAALVLGAVLLLPLGYSLINSQGVQARFSQVGIFGASGHGDDVKRFTDLENEYRGEDIARNSVTQLAHNKYLNTGRILIKNYLDHFNFDFLFLVGDGNQRHHAPNTGMVLLVELPFILLGIFYLLKEKPKHFWFMVIWFLVAPAASSLTSEIPHAVRSLLFLPIFQIMCAVGILSLFKSLKSLKLLKSLIVSILFFINLFYFLTQYFIHMPIEYAESWQYGYKELVKNLESRNDFSKALVTVGYDQPYIYFLFYGDYSPKIKNDGTFGTKLGRYEFVNWKQISDPDKELIPNSVVQVYSPKDLHKVANIKMEIKYPSGKTAFFIGSR